MRLRDFQLRPRRPWCIAMSLCTLALGSQSRIIAAGKVDTSRLPPPAAITVDFERDIRPILEESCLRCHGMEKPKGDFQLTSREAALKGGAAGPAIIPGQSATSPLIHFVAGLVEDMEMPPPNKGHPLTTNQISLLRAWIDQNLPWTPTIPPPVEELRLTPTIGWIFLDGDRGKFREHHWIKDGLYGGLENYEFIERVDDRTSFTVSGRALRDDYRVTLDVQRKDKGFFRAGFEKYNKYFDDGGGPTGLDAPALFELNRDLTLEIGKAWAEVGLNRPGTPQMLLGYEYSWREGNKSVTSWLPGGPFQRNILPNSKHINEETHLLRFDINHEVAGFYLEDNVRYEFYDLETDGISARPFPLTANGQRVLTRDEHDHHRFANTFRAERQLKDWLFVSVGYLFSQLSGDAAIELTSVNAAGAPITGGVSSGDQIVLRQWSHVMNYNAQVGPWHDITLTAGVQNEWGRQEGVGNVTLTAPPFLPVGPPVPELVELRADLDRFSIEEHFALRYTGLPFTSLFAEARFRQESLGESESELGADPASPASFLRDTDTQRDLKDLRTGFHVSPWSRVALTGHYRHRRSDNEYDHERDQRPAANPVGPGYSAFYRSQVAATDEIDTKVVLRPQSWLKTTLGYQWSATDFHLEADPNAGALSGRLRSGDYDANRITLNTVLTPWTRLYLSTTLSYTYSRSKAFANETPSVAPFRGDIYSVLSSLTYAWNARTDLSASYAFSLGDYSQDNAADGVALGIDYQQHGLRAGVGRTLNQFFKVNLQYGYYRYVEPSSGHANDYDAHAVFATMAMRWP